MHYTNREELQVAIADLKQQCYKHEMEMRRDFKGLIKRGEDSIANLSLSLGSGVLAKKLIPFKSDGILSSLVTYGVQGAVTAAAFSNAKKIKAVASAVWKNVFKRRD